MPLNEMNLRPTFNVPILVCFCYFSYVAPEYANTGMLNEKSDIYSFGVLLLEAVTGRDPVDYGRPANEVICLFNTLSAYHDGKIRHISLGTMHPCLLILLFSGQKAFHSKPWQVSRKFYYQFLLFLGCIITLKKLIPISGVQKIPQDIRIGPRLVGIRRVEKSPYSMFLLGEE